jgi:diadenosine tetraphosphatase ApaH/serine/threonine PP2A family protein phosphatase
LRGNHDEAAGGSDDVRLNEDARKTILWSRAQLSAEQLAFLRDAPLTSTDGNCLYVHANGWDPKNYEYIFGPVQAMRSMQVVRARITFCGHMHEPVLYHMGLTQRVEVFEPVPGTPFRLSAARRWLAIPGSVGQPRDGNPAACYASFDELSGLLTFWRVPYDHDLAARKIRAKRPARALCAAAAAWQLTRCATAWTLALPTDSARQPDGALARVHKPGEVIDGYTLVERTHRGGMAELWRVTHPTGQARR